MRGVGLCGSDLTVYDGKRDLPEMPWIPGHEGCGEIVAVGTGVSERRLGETVVEPNYCCLRCTWCRTGRTSACENRGIVGINRPVVRVRRRARRVRLDGPRGMVRRAAWCAWNPSRWPSGPSGTAAWDRRRPAWSSVPVPRDC
ncbi:alcohol dehydrogenase catalytic domain-containing protein [Halosaccharopolyspora lacisalsi]|uniref:alcohol dehydrogenase catalytic domain-containing protein n=1 Tax=Halosaccharopolyspora lacisalsi TaxID=1000566 RepID=UPI001F48934B|nr:alcohol dehydrogenase catalytic domain-containing protein [Halosaccharopolyspora lacisalsi]